MTAESKLAKVEVLEAQSSEESINVEYVFQKGVDQDVVLKNVDSIIIEHDLEEYRSTLERGALIANDPNFIESDGFEDHERLLAEKEVLHPIKSLSTGMIIAALTTSLAAVNFGMDESAVGGAQLQYQEQFNITDPNIQGLTLAAPYLAATVLGSPLVVVLNKYWGRRPIIFVSCLIGVIGSIIQAFSNGLPCLLFARLFMGIGMGLNSATSPVYVAECSPHACRGALLMLWQTFIALGVMLGSVFNRAFVGIEGQLSWRLMIGSSFVPPLLCVLVIHLAPESPRWLISKGYYKGSLKALIKLRPSDVAGARDFYILYESLRYEGETTPQLTLSQQAIALFKVPRNRFALIASLVGILGQQYGGVNILVSYTATILTNAGIQPVTAIAGSIGIGGGCFLSTFIGAKLIDRYGRRRMLLLTLPFEAICLFWLGGVLNITRDSLRLGLGLAAMYVFVLCYGIGIGPVSFILVAETSSISVRMAHSAFCMSANWALDFCLSMTWPKMNTTMGTSGGLYFYGAFNILVWVLAYFFVPETKSFTLEQLDEIFKVGSTNFSSNKLRRLFRIKKA